MKVAAIKLGARITFGGTSGGSGEAMAILEMLSKNNDVHAYTKILKKDKAIPFATAHEIMDEYQDINDQGYDALVVINGGVNYFGGQDDPSQTINYSIINNFKGKVFYILCDPNLTLKQVWPSIEKKPWAGNYKREDIEITRDDIIYISQPKNTDKILEDIKKNNIPVSTCVHYPFEKFPLMFAKPEWKDLSDRQYDLLYGGTFRGGKRQEDMIKFYFGYDDEKVTMFGKIKEKDFNEKKVGTLSHPNYEGAINYDKFNEKMSNSKATVIIGDKYYKQVNDLAQRIYESILSGVVTFIDESYDYEKRVYSDERLRNFLYVKDSNDVKKKLEIINTMSEDVFYQFLQRQYIDIQVNLGDYCKGFSDIIESNLTGE